MPDPVRVGVVGCGAISGQYLKNLTASPAVRIVALADLVQERCEARAGEFGLAGVRICTTAQLMADPSVELVLNLTWPGAHVAVSMQALAAGKHVYSEKPLAPMLAEGKQLLSRAESSGLLFGCAPDTILGSGIQIARKIIDDGRIGRPIGFSAFMMHRGVESWHPNPPFYYEPGGGPMLDMGPYYLAALMCILGPIRRVSGFAAIAIPQRLVTHKDADGVPGPMHGRQIAVSTPDHVCGVMEFASGAVGTIVTSFATHFPSYDPQQPITIYGTEGTLRVPDPNRFDGPVHIRREGEEDFHPAAEPFALGHGRGIGVLDMCDAIRAATQRLGDTASRHSGIRCSAAQACAALEAMQGFLDSSESGRAIAMQLPYSRPAPMPLKPCRL